MSKSNISKSSERPVPGSQETKDFVFKLEDIGWGESKDKYKMDSHKMPWHLDRVKEWVGPKGKGDGKISPLHIDLGITTGCNLGCTYCYGVVQARDGFMGKQGKIFHMPKDAIIRLFDSAKELDIRSIGIVGEGENTLNPALYPSLDHARDIDLDLGLATHARNIKDENINTLLSSLKWLRVNISAADADSYIKVHQQPWFDRVVSNTRKLVDAKRSGGHKTVLGYQMVIVKDNMDQIVPMAKLGMELGLDYTVLKACSDTPDRALDAPDKEYLELVEVFREAESYSNEEYNVIVKWNKLGNLGNKDYFKCDGTRFIIAISGNGSVFPCGHWFDIEKERFIMGNVISTPLEEIVRSKRYWDVQNEIHKVDLRMCETNCRQHYVNQFLDEISNQDDPKDYVDSMTEPSIQPEHKNFV